MSLSKDSDWASLSDTGERTSSQNKKERSWYKNDMTDYPKSLISLMMIEADTSNPQKSSISSSPRVRKSDIENVKDIDQLKQMFNEMEGINKDGKITK